MADDFAVTAGTGTTIRAVEKTSKKAQVVVLDLGGAGAESLLTTTLPVSIAAAPVLVAGTALIGKVGIDQATANANEVVVKSGTVTTVTAVTGITNALPAGTNAIGKLAANSGVDIGDVDVTSITAGENHLGEVGHKTTMTAITFSLDTNIYADGDVLADTQVLAACLRVNDGTGVILDAIFNDEDDQGIAFDVLILNANTSIGTENSAPNISDANARTIIGRFPVTTLDWYDLGGVRIANIPNIGIGVKGATGADDIYIALVSRGAGTYSASGITGYFKILCD